MKHLRATIFALPFAALTSGLDAAHAATATITIDQAAVSKWGLQYPATYVFQVTECSAAAAVKRRDAATGQWTALPRKTADEFFNGVECVRFDRVQQQAYVSVGFQSSPTIELEFSGVGAATFTTIAKYYDGRRAAYTLSNDNWGCNPWAHPGAPWQGATDDESDCYQAALHVCRSFHLPLSIAINSRMA
nr:hypothetical protein [Pirellulaceae bacterium]